MDKPESVLNWVPHWNWDVNKLHSLECKEYINIKLSDFDEMLMSSMWGYSNELDFDLCPQEILNRMRCYDGGLIGYEFDTPTKHCKRIANADLTNKIDLIYVGGEGFGVRGFLLLDGLHRVCKAKLLGHIVITCRAHTYDVRYRIEVI